MEEQKKVSNVTTGIGSLLLYGGRKSQTIKDQLIARLEAEQAEHKKQLDAQKNAGVKRLNETKWPKEWTRKQKRLCVAACKRAGKKGYSPGTKEWDGEMARAGFKPTVKE